MNRLLLRSSPALIAPLLFAFAVPQARGAELRLSLEGGYNDMSNARRSARAVFDGTSGGALGGVSARLAFGRYLFVAVGGRYFQREGERVFVNNPGDEVFRLGHPLTIRIIPAYGQVGCRFRAGRRLVPYVAAGGGAASYREESTVAGEVDTFSATKPSFHFATGADWGRGAFTFGLDVMYALVPDTIGGGGVSQIFGESDVGGLSAVARISFGGRL